MSNWRFRVWNAARALGTKTPSSPWPWAALGLPETVDREAIHAAYAARRAELDSANMRISAFAELTEAREKALFLASEKRREAARSGEVKETPPAPPPRAPTAPPAPDPPAPPPEPAHQSEPESLGEERWEHAGGYKPRR